MFCKNVQKLNKRPDSLCQNSITSDRHNALEEPYARPFWAQQCIIINVQMCVCERESSLIICAETERFHLTAGVKKELMWFLRMHLYPALLSVSVSTPKLINTNMATFFMTKG